MKYTTFEETPVYKLALNFCKDIYEITGKTFKKDFGLIDQTRRASVSIMLNIAEGFERNTNRDFAHFISFSKGSAGEVRAILHLAKEIGYLDEDDYNNLYKQVINISENLAKLQTFLKKSAYPKNKE